MPTNFVFKFEALRLNELWDFLIGWGGFGKSFCELFLLCCTFWLVLLTWILLLWPAEVLELPLDGGYILLLGGGDDILLLGGGDDILLLGGGDILLLGDDILLLGGGEILPFGDDMLLLGGGGGVVCLGGGILLKLFDAVGGCWENCCIGKPDGFVDCTVGGGYWGLLVERCGIGGEPLIPWAGGLWAPCIANWFGTWEALVLWGVTGGLLLNIGPPEGGLWFGFGLLLHAFWFWIG